MRHLKELKVKRNVVLYDYKDPVDNFYIIRQGEVEVSRFLSSWLSNRSLKRPTFRLGMRRFIEEQQQIQGVLCKRKNPIYLMLMQFGIASTSKSRNNMSG